jgi:hypothetical protein
MRLYINTAFIIFPKYINLLLILVIIFMSFIFIGCTERNYVYQEEHPPPIYVRSLIDVEINQQPDYYMKDFIGIKTIKLDYPAPLTKPSYHWVYNNRYFYLVDPLVVDRTGGIWFFKWIEKEDKYFETIDKVRPKLIKGLFRLSPDKTISWERFTSDPFIEYYPAAVLNGAVVWFVKTFETGKLYRYTLLNILKIIKAALNIPIEEISLECIDNDGNTVWRTEINKVCSDYYSSNLSSRISNDRIMFAIGNLNSGLFKIFSLKNGSLLKTIEFQDWFSGKIKYKPLYPI